MPTVTHTPLQPVWQTRTYYRRLLWLTPVALLVVGATAFMGPYWIDPRAVLGEQGFIFWQYRYPRTVLAALVGGGLALGGVIFQALFRNPLATPYTLGVASGASLAAALGFLLGWRGQVAGLPVLSLLAFFGALGAMSVVYLLARLRGSSSLAHLLLGGVCVAYLSSGGMVLIYYLADPTVATDIVWWLMGTLAINRPEAAREVAVALALVLLLAVYNHRALDLMTLGDHWAASRGVPVERTIWTSYFAVGVLTAVIVGNCGPIGFVGLMAPHMARALFGARSLPLMLGSVLIGGVFLAVCDGLARLDARELPVGVLTNILGAIFFLYLLATRDSLFAADKG